MTAYLSLDVLESWRYQRLSDEQELLYTGLIVQVLQTPKGRYISETPRGHNYCYAAVPLQRFEDQLVRIPDMPTLVLHFVFLSDDEILIHYADPVDSDDGLLPDWRERGFQELP